MNKLLSFLNRYSEGSRDSSLSPPGDRTTARTGEDERNDQHDDACGNEAKQKPLHLSPLRFLFGAECPSTANAHGLAGGGNRV
jgi:hypothetical protein